MFIQLTPRLEYREKETGIHFNSEGEYVQVWGKTQWISPDGLFSLPDKVVVRRCSST